MSSENKIPGFPTYRLSIPIFQPLTLSITNQTWVPNQTTFSSLNFASQSFRDFPRPSSSIAYEIKSPTIPTSFKHENTFNPISLVKPPSNFSPDFSLPEPFIDSEFASWSFLDNQKEKSCHVKPDFPRYTATEKLFFNAFDSFSKWAQQTPPTSLNLPETRELSLSQSQIGMPSFNATTISFQADCWMSVKNGTDLNNRPITSIDIKVTKVTIGFFEPGKVSVAGLTRTEKNRIAERTRQYEISANESRDRYMARKFTGDAERPLSRFISVTGKMGPGGSLEIDISRYTWNKNLEWQTSEVLKSRPPVILGPTHSNLPKTWHSLNADPSCSPHYYRNGILNKDQDSITGAKQLQETHGGFGNIVPAYGESYGFSEDLTSVWESAVGPDYKNYMSDSIRTYSRNIQWDVLCLEALNDPRKVFITCFSRGAADTYHAVKDFTPEQKQRLIIVACGPIMTLPRDLGFKVTNLISTGDFFSLAFHPQLLERPEWYKRFADIIILLQKDRNGLNGDHFFLSKTYQEALEEQSVDDYKEYGVLR